VVVDDDPSVRRALDRLLRSEGFAVVTFTSAEQFLGLCHPDAVACLILDLHLAGMSGAELQAHMAAAGTTVPTIIITAHDDVAAREAARRSGSRAFLRKPFDDQEMIDAVVRAVDRLGLC
jgi:FixJ family two-component response regulator